MTCWALIPIKAPDLGKSRLAGVLEPAAREALVEAMLRHVVRVAGAAVNVDGVALVGGPWDNLPAQITPLADPGGGLNAALQSGLADLLGRGLSRLIILAGDLPMLTIQEVELLAGAPPRTVAIAADRHGIGTNAISLPLPEASMFTFAFGIDSFARHKAEGERLDLRVETIHSPGLARDIDEPADLADAGSLASESEL